MRSTLVVLLVALAGCASASQGGASKQSAEELRTQRLAIRAEPRDGGEFLSRMHDRYAGK